MTIDNIRQIIADADAESFDGLVWRAGRGEYFQRDSSAGWEDGMAGVVVNEYDQVWISADAVAESAQDRRVEALLEAGYSTELAGSQRHGFDREALEGVLDQ